MSSTESVFSQAAHTATSALFSFAFSLAMVVG
jgi:hypothetical protein